MSLVKRKLVMNASGFPEAFRNADMKPPAGMTRQEYMEECLIKALNSYNPKLEITAVEYGDIVSQFPRAKAGKKSGMIVEDCTISASEEEEYRDKGCYVFQNGTECVARSILLYVYMPFPEEQGKDRGRDSLISQTLFPTLIDYMGEYLDSPGYSAADHPFYFIDVSINPITAATILENLASLSLVGIEYIQVFSDLPALREIPGELKAFLEKYDVKFLGRYNALKDYYQSEFYDIDFANKKFFVRKANLEDNVLHGPGKDDFRGSGEKFYWMKVYPMAVAAYDRGYQVDYAEYEEFCDKYRSTFSKNSDKMKRCDILLRYFRKYIS